MKQYDIHNNILNELHEGKGIMKQYNSEGKAICQIDYLDGVKNGKHKHYYDSGALKIEGAYLNDEINGKEKEYYRRNIMMMVN